MHRVGEVLIEVENLDIVDERSAGRGRQIERAVDPHDVDAGAAIELPVAKIVQDEDVVARTADNLFKTNELVLANLGPVGRRHLHRSAVAKRSVAEVQVESNTGRRAVEADRVEAKAAVVEIISFAIRGDDDVAAATGKDLIVALQSRDGIGPLRSVDDIGPGGTDDDAAAGDDRDGLRLRTAAGGSESPPVVAPPAVPVPVPALVPVPMGTTLPTAIGLPVAPGAIVTVKLVC